MYRLILIALALAATTSVAIAQSTPVVINEPQGSLQICVFTQGVGSIVRVVCQ
jgi:hypothetical protein